MRELNANEIYKLEECLKELADYHNEVSVNFKNHYPRHPFSETLILFGNDIKNGKSRIAVVEENGEILGFCKADTERTEGKIDFLIVLKRHRGKGYGKCLMDWAMGTFEENGIKNIEVKVVDGNDVIHLYEQYGFRINAHILKLSIN